MEPALNVLIIEDHELMTWALIKVIRDGFDNAILQSAFDLERGLEILKETDIQLVMLDLDIPGGNSPRMIAQIRQIRKEVRILIYSGLSEKHHALKYIMAGADGFISKNAPKSAVCDAVRTVLSDKKYLQPITQEAVVNALIFKKFRRQISDTIRLTKREQDVLRLLLKGKWTNEIADELGLQPNTISTHKGSIYIKFGVTNPVELFEQVRARMPELLHENESSPSVK
ncbi:two component transcriptional regulator, LuxR family [Dyadobacter soli]|uniref:Two component transcriptional regulator, LuxR family n=1 Tax=Dyadobacter soli TaxID=659014 RepID=A0A1G7FUU2_9BACT|nr:response regulator transcription factor [Dyadobacter soli]SDE79552.1 two component transcriptional regulator, LuxR family [Dyadobacter soli]